jgi:hypothetical protein
VPIDNITTVELDQPSPGPTTPPPFGLDRNRSIYCANGCDHRPTADPPARVVEVGPQTARGLAAAPVQAVFISPAIARRPKNHSLTFPSSWTILWRALSRSPIATIPTSRKIVGRDHGEPLDPRRRHPLSGLAARLIGTVHDRPHLDQSESFDPDRDAGDLKIAGALRAYPKIRIDTRWAKVCVILAS